MKDKKKFKELVQAIINLHETKDFYALSGYISQTEI